MNITLKQPALDKLKDVKEVGDYLRYHSWNKKVALKLDVGKLPEAQLERVRAVMQQEAEAYRHGLKTLELYEQARANPKNCVAKTLEQFAPILKGYVASVPKFRIYQEGEDGDYNAFVATGVGYVKARRERDYVRPAFVFLKAAYYHQGGVHYVTWNFHADEVRGSTCSQVLDNSYLITGSPDLDTQYEQEVARYKELRGAVGKQVWGKGTCVSTGSRWDRTSYSLDVDGRRSRLVIDDHVEGTNRDKNESTEGEVPTLDGSFWREKVVSDDDDDEPSVAGEETALVLEVPLRPTVLLFNLEKHEQCWAHVNRLEEYAYDTSLGEKLVLPDYQRELVEILVQRDRAELQDIIRGKAGGSIVLCSGDPGTGKTLTAEVFAETIQRPLYVVASSQLGTNPESLESELKSVLTRASRLGAILLIDEADVFIHERGESMVQNAVVGVFLRILEYFQGVMFMTTNRATIVDDAIVSRCTAQVKFEIPNPENQKKIWKILSELSGLKVSDREVDKFVRKHPALSGRDVKGLLKLANLISVKRKVPIDEPLLSYVMQFKPTAESMAADRGEK